MLNLNDIYQIIFESWEPDTKIETSLDDLNFDSMAQILLIAELEERFDIVLESEIFEGLITLNDLSTLISRKIS
jgi:acyl carrier protein|tara:strand:- start:69 stop:290 length:222 start_codon:yes stop_codon:yes gene_type:complete